MTRLRSILRASKRDAVGAPDMSTPLSRRDAGFTLGEFLIAALIAAIVMLMIATGTMLALDQYQKTMRVSESKVLCSTLSSRISDELRFAVVEDAASSPRPGGGTTYTFSEIWIPEVGYTSGYTNLNAAGEPQLGYAGYLALPYTDKAGQTQYFKLIPNAAYTRNMMAHVDIECYSPTSHLDDVRFAVTVVITDDKGQQVLTNSFDVIPLDSTTIG